MTTDGQNAETPLILGLGGSGRTESASRRALESALTAAKQAGGVRTELLDLARLEIPPYAPGNTIRNADTSRLVEHLRLADGLIIASPGYHGGPTALIKNALEYAEDLRNDVRPYLDGRAVGLIVTASGWQATVTALVSLRSIVHALRGWPTPLGVPVNTVETPDPTADPVTAERLAIMAGQVARFAKAWR